MTHNKYERKSTGLTSAARRHAAAMRELVHCSGRSDRQRLNTELRSDSCDQLQRSPLLLLVVDYQIVRKRTSRSAISKVIMSRNMVPYCLRDRLLDYPVRRPLTYIFHRDGCSYIQAKTTVESDHRCTGVLTKSKTDWTCDIRVASSAAA